MAPREVVIFQQWQNEHGNEYDRFDYNVRIGNGTDPGPQYSQSDRDMYISNTQKRIDAVGWKGAPVEDFTAWSPQIRSTSGPIDWRCNSRARRASGP